MKRALLAMAIGTFSLGICEFVIRAFYPMSPKTLKSLPPKLVILLRPTLWE